VTGGAEHAAGVSGTGGVGCVTVALILVVLKNGAGTTGGCRLICS
jgi:hypothetical protein